MYQLFVCLFVESLLLSLSNFPIVIFILTIVAMTFISSSFISPSLSSLLVVFGFFLLIQKIQCEWCGYPSCWLPTIVRFLSHGKFWVWRWRMDTSHEDWRQKGAYVYYIIISCINPLSLKTLQVKNLHVTYVCLLFFIEKVIYEEQTRSRLIVSSDCWERMKKTLEIHANIFVANIM